MKIKNDIDFISFITGILIIIFIIYIIVSISYYLSRADNNMVFIEYGYCYHEDTKIIYTEEKKIHGIGYDYYKYHDKENNIYKYDKETDEWIKVKVWKQKHEK